MQLLQSLLKGENIGHGKARAKEDSRQSLHAPHLTRRSSWTLERLPSGVYVANAKSIMAAQIKVSTNNLIHAIYVTNVEYKSNSANKCSVQNNFIYSSSKFNSNEVGKFRRVTIKILHIF